MEIGRDGMDKIMIEGVCTKPENVPCLLEFNLKMDCCDCGFYNNSIEDVKWDG